jgi:AraC-like DNA-binding protein
MQFYRPHGLLAGFHADRPEPAVPELQFLGEQWLPVNREIGWHQHEVWEFYQQLDGETRWRSHSARYHLGPGNFFAAAPGVQHQLTGASGKHHFVFAAIDVAVVAARHPAIAEFWPGLRGNGATRPDGKPGNSRKPGAKGRDAATPAQIPLACIHLTNAESLETPFRQVVREAGMLRPLRAEGLRAAVDYLVIEATRLLAHPAEKVLVPMHPGVHKAKDLLERHSSQPWRLAELGRLTGLSPNHLVTLFVRDLGVSPHQYLLRQRVERAKHQLAHSDVAVAAIASDLGFASPQHFARVFAATAGCSASAWRARAVAGRA